MSRCAQRWNGLASAVALLAAALAAQAQGEIVWRDGLRLQRQIKGSVPDTMRIPLAGRQFVRIEVIQNGSDLAATLRDPRGRPLIDVDSANGRYGPATVVAVT